MKLWNVKHRWLLTDSDLKPRHAGMSEQVRCQIVGDYPTREKALAGAHRLINKRKEIAPYALHRTGQA